MPVAPPPSDGRPYTFACLAEAIAKWARHLYYWVFTPCMVGVTALLIGYLLNSFWPDTFGGSVNPLFMFFCPLFALGVSYIAFRRVMGTKAMNVAINITPLILFSIAISYRVQDPEGLKCYQLVNGTGGVDYVVEEEQVVEDGKPKVDSDGQPVMKNKMDEDAVGIER